MGLKERFLRWRATKGYGVHSPLAFRLVKNVLRPPRDVVYYGEERLAGRLSRSNRRQIRRARVLLRFVAEMHPAVVWTTPGLPELYLEAIRLAGCVVRIYDGALFPAEIDKADMVVAEGKKLKKKELEKALRPGRSLIAFGVKEKMEERVTLGMKSGVILEGEGSLIAVADTGGALHKYYISRF